MENLVWAGLGILTIVGGLFLNMLASEAYDWSEKIAEKIVRFASKRTPADQRDRWEEEWLAHLNDTPGKLSKVIYAIGILVAAPSIRAQQYATDGGNILDDDDIDLSELLEVSAKIDGIETSVYFEKKHWEKFIFQYDVPENVQITITRCDDDDEA